MHTLIQMSVVVFVLFTTISSTAYASSNNSLEVSGWIPYWNDVNGIKDAKKHISSIDGVYPFAYSVLSDGGIKDLTELNKSDWQSFFRIARKKDVEIMPTIMWSDGVAMHAVLSDPNKRAQHIDTIVKMVKKGKYDGIDIDYEGKKSDTKEYFSAFLTELKAELGNKTLSCTIEARTPPASLYREIPESIAYVNDYEVINNVCDRVVIMAYDQQRADLLLNKTKNGTPYMPVADVDWVRKVVALALKDIDKEKIVLGIPTYGHHWSVTVAPDWFRDYKKIGALNVPDIKDVAKEYRVTPTRNKSGEMSFSYLPKSSTVKLPSSLKIPKGTPKGDIVAQRALAYANKTGEEVTFNIAWYSDAEAMKDKIDLAKEFGLRGVSFFKFDGEEDQAVWKMLD